jgi:hypothetical protein
VIALCAGVVETVEEGAEELEVLQALSIFLAQRVAARLRHEMVRYKKLPGWQARSLSRLPNLNTADSVPKRAET